MTMNVLINIIRPSNIHENLWYERPWLMVMQIFYLFKYKFDNKLDGKNI